MIPSDQIYPLGAGHINYDQAKTEEKTSFNLKNGGGFRIFPRMVGTTVYVNI